MAPPAEIEIGRRFEDARGLRVEPVRKVILLEATEGSSGPACETPILEAEGQTLVASTRPYPLEKGGSTNLFVVDKSTERRELLAFITGNQPGPVLFQGFLLLITRKMILQPIPTNLPPTQNCEPSPLP